MRRVFETMGTVASIELPSDSAVAPAELQRLFAEYDARFSLYEPHSELSQVRDGRLALLDATAALRDSYLRAIEWRERTLGWFTPNRPDGVIDLNGIVKAEAIESAGALLESRGVVGWTINVGGDILVSGDRDWPTGIVDPRDRSALVASVRLGAGRRAMATSGSAERGDHIWGSGRAGAVEFIQVSVIARDIVTADVLATAIVAGGREALDDATDRYPIEVLAVCTDTNVLATPGIAALAG